MLKMHQETKVLRLGQPHDRRSFMHELLRENCSSYFVGSSGEIRAYMLLQNLWLKHLYQ